MSNLFCSAAGQRPLFPGCCCESGAPSGGRGRECSRARMGKARRAPAARARRSSAHPQPLQPAAKRGARASKGRGSPGEADHLQQLSQLALGAQEQRWLQFLQKRSLSCEEAAKLLLDTFEHQGLVKHTGGCHCGAVRFEVWASADLHVFDCNCSICIKKQNKHFIVPAQHFKLLKGTNNLTTYTFNTHRAQHTFCKTCGVQSFYTPRSNPDGYGIAASCLDEGTVRSITLEPFNGKDWEKAVKAHPTIETMSKP